MKAGEKTQARSEGKKLCDYQEALASDASVGTQVTGRVIKHKEVILFFKNNSKQILVHGTIFVHGVARRIAHAEGNVRKGQIL